VKPERDDWDDDERRALKDVEAEFAQLRERHRDDPPFELLRAAHADALPESLQAPLREHLEQSAWSRALVDVDTEAEPPLEAEVERRLLTRINRSSRSKPAARWYTWSWLPALAAAAVLVLIVAVMRQSGPARVESQPGPPAATPAAPVPAAPVYTLALDKPDVKLTPEALVLRSDARGARFVDDIAPALNAYRANDDVEAERQFASLETRYPKSIEVAFYRGVTELLLNDPAGAIRSLDRARRLDNDAFTAEVGWYLAVAYERAGNTSRARAELDVLCRHTSAYTSKACAAAAKLKSE